MKTWLGAETEKSFENLTEEEREAAEAAIEAFIKRKEEFDLMLDRLVEHSADYFNIAPVDLTWGHVGSLVDWISQLRRVSDAVFKEGGYAPTRPRYPAARVWLSNRDGNALAVLGEAIGALRAAGVPQQEIDAFRIEATARDYDHMLRVCLEWVDVV